MSDPIDHGSEEPTPVEPVTAAEPQAVEPEGKEPEPNEAVDVSEPESDHVAQDEEPRQTPDVPRGAIRIEAQEATAAQHTSRRSRVRWGRVGARVGVTVVVVALLPITVLGALVTPQLTVTAAPASVAVKPAASYLDLVCAGPARMQGNAQGNSTGTVLGSADIAAASSDVSGVRIGELDGGDIASALADEAPRLAQAGVTGRKAAAVIGAQANTGGGLVGAVQTETLSREDVSGYSATACTTASSDAWLVGGDTTTGRVVVLRLLNSSTNEADVTIQAYTDVGKAKESAASVPPSGEVSIPLSAVAPGAKQLAIHVTSTGAPIAAYLQQTSIDALTPVGFDLWSYGAPASVAQYIPGVLVAGRGATVRLISETDTAATITAISASGGTGSASEISLKAGIATDVSMTSLADGMYQVNVASDAPVAAAALVSRAGASNSLDFGWIPSASLSTQSVVFAVPALAAGQSATLTVYPDIDGTVVLTDAGGGQKSVAVSAQTPVTLPLSSGGYTLNADTAYAAVVTVSGAGSIAGYPVTAADTLAVVETVFPQ